MNADLIVSSILHTADQKINPATFRGKYRIGNAFSRSGKLSFPNLMYYVLQSTHSSISINYSHMPDSFLPSSIPFVSKQAISKASKPVSIRQEFFAAMFLSNLTAILKKHADSEIIASAENKHKYQTNRSYILNRIKSNIIFLLKASLHKCSRMIRRIKETSAKVLSIIRPDRKFGRYRKHTRRRYYNHLKSCL